MPFTEEQLTLLNTTFDSLPDNVKAMFNAASTQDTATAITKIISQRRKDGMVQVMAMLITGSVADWAQFKEAAQYADGTTFMESLKAFNDAMLAEDAEDMLRAAVAVCVAARKNYGLTT